MSHLHRRRATAPSTAGPPKRLYEEEEVESDVTSEEEEEEEEEQTAEEEESSESDDESNELVAEEERIRNALANVPFGQLVAIQKKMGIKAYNEQFGAQSKAKSKLKSNKQSDSEEDSEEDSDDMSNYKHNRLEKEHSREIKIPAKPTGKHRPIEVTSKKPVGRFRQVVESDKKKSRDPRFDRLSGHFNEDLFQKAYGFIDEYRQSELQQMKQELRKTKRPEQAESLQQTIKRLESKEASRLDTKRRQELKSRIRKEEAEKRSEFKRMELVDKYEKLTGANGGTAKLDRILEKRRKRNATKERKAMPKRRRTVMEE
ncbi:hypothetical protein BDF19DRAFT_496140 [Syncephalis fuscata]|nr:hypothetical protein BDF19DRAFT_496140 [Syncephalis fuscata]